MYARSAQRRTLRRVDAPDLSEFSPLSASGYFTQAVSVQLEDRGLDIRAYYSPPAPTVESSGESGTVMVCHHGAGSVYWRQGFIRRSSNLFICLFATLLLYRYSGLTFACFANEVVKQSKGECGVLAFDARRHGAAFAFACFAPPFNSPMLSGKTTSLSGAEDSDLHIDTLTADLVALLISLFPDPKTTPTFILVGHSMGGAACVRACPVLQEKKYSVGGVAVLDVVEGVYNSL